MLRPLLLRLSSEPDTSLHIAWLYRTWQRLLVFFFSLLPHFRLPFAIFTILVDVLI